MIKLLVCLLLLSGCAARSRTIVIMPNPYIEAQERQIKMMELEAQEKQAEVCQRQAKAQERQVKIIAEKTASEKRKE